MIQISFIKILHLNLLWFKYLTIIKILLIANIMDMPMYSAAYVQKGYVGSDLVDIWN